MDWEDFTDWLNWGLIATAFLVVAVTALIALLTVVYVAVKYVQFRFRRGNNGGNRPPPSIEELLGSIPDVAFYRELPPGPGEDRGADDGDESCAICVTPYEAGEACSVLPGCAHMFHKPCVAKWLRKKSTCPLCRAKVTVGQGNGTNAAENMV